MSFYTGLRGTANKLLLGKGQPMVITQRVAGAYDPTTSTTAITSTDYAGTGAAFDYKDKEIDGSKIKAGDKKVLLSAEGLAIVPTDDDLVTFGGVIHTIQGVKNLSPGGTTVLFVLQVRRGG